MSGTIAHMKRLRVEAEKELNKILALQTNRTELLTAVAAYMHTAHGDDSFYNNHPLVSAILQSASGEVIDLEQLANNIATFQAPEAE